MLPLSGFGSAGEFALGLVAMGVFATAAPCDIYATGKTPCAAAHSTTRALYDAYTGPLYQVIRGSDGMKLNIGPLPNGIANASAQDSFCSATTCLITTIYDQSGHNNDLTQAPPGNVFGGPDVDHKDNLASAIGAPATLNGTKVYGVFSPPGTGYRNDGANGTATGDAPEGIYAVFDGTHFNDGCCYDYGNAETNNSDNGNGTMEAIYFGNRTDAISGRGQGTGPWIEADLENGLFANQYKGPAKGNNPNLIASSFRFVTAIIKGNASQWAIRGGDATSGPVNTYFSGPRPDYYTMRKEGAIVLGIGGDNSGSGQGTFYEGVMTTGVPSDETETAVQANIVAAKYGVAPLTSGPQLTVNSSVSFRVTTPGFADRYIVHNGSAVITQVVNSSSAADLKKQASFTVRTGLGFTGCFSFESNDTPGSFLRHNSFNITLDVNARRKKFFEDATYCPMAGLNGQGNTLRSWNFPTRFFRHYGAKLYAASNGGVSSQPYDATTSFNNDVSFVLDSGFA